MQATFWPVGSIGVTVAAVTEIRNGSRRNPPRTRCHRAESLRPYVDCATSPPYCPRMGTAAFAVLRRAPTVNGRSVLFASLLLVAIGPGQPYPAKAGNGAHEQALTLAGSSRILYRDGVRQGDGGSANPPIGLWVTDGNGQHARRLFTLQPAALDGTSGFRGAQLTSGGVVYGLRDARDGNVTDLHFRASSAMRGRLLFRVRGLLTFSVSPDGARIAYVRRLPVAGDPSLKVVTRSGRTVKVFPNEDGEVRGWSRNGLHVSVWSAGTLYSLDVRNGARQRIPVRHLNIQGLPSVSPSGTRVAYWDLTGPAGERVYSTSGKLLRNIVGVGGNEAFWSPDEQRLLMQAPGLRMFDFRTGEAHAFVHTGPRAVEVLDWR